MLSIETGVDPFQVQTTLKLPLFEAEFTTVSLMLHLFVSDKNSDEGLHCQII